MKVLAQNVEIKLYTDTYLCDILLGLYSNTKRPAILLVEACPSTLPGGPIWGGNSTAIVSPTAIASTNAPAEYLQHLSSSHFTMKNHAENAGLWEQLLPLTDEDGFPLFHATQHVITLDFVTCRIGCLGVLASELFSDLISEKEFLHG